MVELKGYIYCFGNIIVLLKYVQGRKGFKNFSYLSLHTFCMTPRTKRRQARAKYLQSNDGVKLLSAVDSQI